MKVGLTAKIGFCMIGLKLVGLIAWSWWVILAPFYVMWALSLVLYLTGKNANKDNEEM